MLNKKTLNLLFFSFFIFNAFLVGCAHENTSTDRMKLMDEDDIRASVDEESDKKEVFNGLYNVLTMQGTLINSKVNQALLHQQARMYQWDESKMNAERLKSEDKMKLQTEIFLSFFTPERKHDDLHKNQTLWKIFLDVDGKRYEGKATKVKLLTTEIQSLYSYHNRFYTPYMISFPVSAKNIENKPATLTVTGPVGSSQLSFK